MNNDYQQPFHTSSATGQGPRVRDSRYDYPADHDSRDYSNYNNYSYQPDAQQDYVSYESHDPNMYPQQEYVSYNQPHRNSSLHHYRASSNRTENDYNPPLTRTASNHNDFYNTPGRKTESLYSRKSNTPSRFCCGLFKTQNGCICTCTLLIMFLLIGLGATGFFLFPRVNVKSVNGFEGQGQGLLLSVAPAGMLIYA